jgi:glycosyltransferase involved in cell wall biosynthesis
MLAGQPEPGYKDVLEEKIEKLGLEREVDARFEFLPQEELNLCIQAADILVYPYRSITQSGALLTGLKAGKPIVASSVGGFNEMIQHEQTGVLIEYGNEEQLAKELVDLLRDPERREQLGHAAQEMVETEYSWEAIAHKTLECYQSVVNSRQ